MTACTWINCVFQRNYMHDNYGVGGFVKGGSLYNTFDGNVYVNPSTATQLGLHARAANTGPTFADPNVPYESMYTVIRNNIVKGAQRGALPSNNGAYCYAYNNLWYDCASGNSGYSYVTCIIAGRAPASTTTARHFYIFNNIFYDPQGDMRPYGWAQGGSGYYGGLADRKQQLLESAATRSPWTPPVSSIPTRKPGPPSAIRT